MSELGRVGRVGRVGRAGCMHACVLAPLAQAAGAIEPTEASPSLPCCRPATATPPPARLGYRTAATEKNKPLYFLMVHQRVEA